MAGGEEVVNGGNVADFDDAAAMVAQAVATFGTLDVVVNNAGILGDKVLVNMSADEWDSVIAVHLRGTFDPPRRRVLARPRQGRRARRRAGDQHDLDVRDLRQRRADELRCRRGRHRLADDARGRRAAPLRVTVNAIALRALTGMTESRYVTGRVFDVSGLGLAIAEGWHRGPGVPPIEDPTLVGLGVEELMFEARPNADMTGADREGPGRPSKPVRAA